MHTRIVLAALCVIVFVGTLSAGCGPVPWTRDELARLGEEGRGDVVRRFEVVERPLPKLAELMTERTQRCLNIGFLSGLGPVYYVSTFELRGPGRAQLTVQRRQEGLLPKGPPTGHYVFAADLRAVGSGRTAVVTYRYGFPQLGEVYGAIDRWLHGDHVGCPEMQ